VERLFSYYCRKLGRDPERYTLTAERRKKAEMRLRERAKRAGPEKALEEAKQCIDNLAASEYHRSQGYMDWTEQIFRSAEEFEKRLNWQKPERTSNGFANGVNRGIAEADAYLEGLRNRAIAEESGDTPSSGGVGGDLRRVC
jgi:hypothetical protein